MNGGAIVSVALVQPLACLAQVGEWRATEHVQWTELMLRSLGKTGFTQLDPAATGILFTNTLDERSSTANRVLENGSGVAVGDFD